MSKKKGIHNNKSTDLVLSEDLFDSFVDEEAMSGIFGTVVNASCEQMKVAVELTKLILDKSQQHHFSEVEVLNTFDSAMKTIASYSTLQEILKQEAFD